MSSSILWILPLATLGTSIALPSLALRQAPTATYTNTAVQSYPATAPDPSSFYQKGSLSADNLPLIGEPPQLGGPVDPVYGTRNIDLPFGRLFEGNIKFFPEGELNSPGQNTDVFSTSPDLSSVSNDNANQSACGIPDNAFFQSKVAIHPYFLKYAALDRKQDAFP